MSANTLAAAVMPMAATVMRARWRIFMASPFRDVEAQPLALSAREAIVSGKPPTLVWESSYQPWQSGVQPPLLPGHQDALAGHGEGGGAQADVVAIGGGPDFPERVGDDLVQALVDLVLGPEEAAEVLHPCEIAYGDAAPIADDSGHHQHAALGEHVVR